MIKFYIILFIVLISCKNDIKTNNTEEKRYNKLDTLKIYSNGKLEKAFLLNNKDTIAALYYFENNIIKKRIKSYEEIFFEIWEDYNMENRNLKSISCIILKSGKLYKSQYVEFNKNKQIDFKQSYFYRKFGDTLMYYSPLDTLTQDEYEEREINLFVYDEKDKRIEFTFNKDGKIIIPKGYDYPFFIVENAGIKTDSINNGENMIKGVFRDMIVLPNNHLFDDD